MTTVLIPVIIVSVILLLIVGLLSIWRKVPQDKAMVITGLRKKIIKGGGGLVIPILERTDVISLENMKIGVRTDGALTENGVAIIVDGVTVLKVRNNNESIYAAMEQFNTGKEGETIDRIVDTAKEVLEGKLREIISKMTVEDVYKDREKFASEVQAVAAQELAKMGLEIKSFSIKDIDDKNDYIVSLGKKRIAEVKRDAAIAEASAKSEENIKTAEAQRNSNIETAKANKEGEQARIEAETEIAEYNKNKELKVQAYRKDQETEKAKADLAYEIEQNKTQKHVVESKMEVNLLQKNREIELAERDAIKRERELEATVKKDADAQKYKAEKEAEAKNFEKVKDAEARSKEIELEGKAQAEAKRLEGMAEVEIIREKGKAEAEAMREKAESFKLYNEAAVVQMLVEKLPEIAKSVAEPLSKTEKIVVIDNGGEGKGASKVSGYVTDIMSQLPETMEALTGINIMDMIAGKYKNEEDSIKEIDEDQGQIDSENDI